MGESADFQSGKSGIFIKLDGASADSHCMRSRAVHVVAIVVAILVVGSFVNAVAEGWYFGRCDQPLGIGCETMHVAGVTMSRDNTAAVGASEPPGPSVEHERQRAQEVEGEAKQREEQEARERPQRDREHAIEQRKLEVQQHREERTTEEQQQREIHEAGG